MTQFDWSSFSTPKSVSQQYDVSYNGGLGKTTYFGGPQSTGIGSSISGAFNNITGSLGSSGMSAVNSVKSALDKAFGGGARGVGGQLMDNMGAAEPYLSNIPGGSSVVDPPKNFQYPSDPGKIFMLYQFYDLYQNSPIERANLVSSVSIALPLSTTLQEQFGMMYSEKQLGMLGILEKSGLIDSIRNGAFGSRMTAEEAGERVGSSIRNMATKEGAQTIAAIGRRAIQGLSDAAGSAVDRATGTLLNPYAELQFEGISLREHTFTYTFSPNSKADADTLKEIIKQFRFRMHPTRNGLLFDFPDVCDISIIGVGDDFLYKIHQSYLKSMAVNYAPTNSPSFFKGGDCPTEVSLSLTFGERKPLTRSEVL